jgi:hypothetical protein
VLTPLQMSVLSNSRAVVYITFSESLSDYTPVAARRILDLYRDDSAPRLPVLAGRSTRGTASLKLADASDHVDQPDDLAGQADEEPQDLSYAVPPTRTTAMLSHHRDLRCPFPRSCPRGLPGRQSGTCADSNRTCQNRSVEGLHHLDLTINQQVALRDGQNRTGVRDLGHVFLVLPLASDPAEVRQSELAARPAGTSMTLRA